MMVARSCWQGPVFERLDADDMIEAKLGFQMPV